ncbi:MAG: hypothetical protein WCA46_03085, partial [Actinocatenispora sp.]
VAVAVTEPTPTGVVLAGEGDLFAASARWEPAPDRDVGPDPTGSVRDVWDVTLTVTYRGAEPAEGWVRVCAGFRATDPYWLIPGLFYGENRPADCDRVFPRYAVGADDPAGLVSEHWTFRSDRAATPVVFGWGDTGGVALATTETSPVGLTGLGFRRTTDHGTVLLTFPSREEPVSYTGEPHGDPPLAERYRWRTGESRTLRYTVYALDGDRHGYAPVLRHLHGRLAADSPLRPWVDVPTAADLAAWGLYRWHYRPDPGVLLETAAFDRELNGNVGGRGDRPAMHVAWVSGAPYAAALLAHGRRVGRSEYVTAGGRVLDLIAGNLAPCGTFWGQWTEDGWQQSWTPVRHGLHSRTLAEATLFFARALRAEQNAGTARPSWRDAIVSTVDFVLRRQDPEGNPGSLYHALDGRVLSWSGSAGLTWVPALVEAADVLDRPELLDAARRAGAYYARFVWADFLHGAPEDVDLAPSSEDGYAAVIAYQTLYEATGEQRWLALACRAADWTLTFRYSYNVEFDPRSQLGVYSFASRGADQASPSNQHLHAYGLVCLPELVRLAGSSGQPYYAERAAENLACFRQFVARTDGDFNAYRGMVTERFYQTACFQPKGMLLTLSHAWSVGVLLHACEAVLTDPRLAALR